MTQVEAELDTFFPLSSDNLIFLGSVGACVVPSLGK